MGVADSGADLGLCTLHDPAVPALTALNASSVTGPGVVYSSSTHRKVAQYYSLFGSEWVGGRASERRVR